MTTAAQKRKALADAAALAVARGAFAAKAIQASKGRGVAPLPKGMRGPGIYRRETNAVTLAPIPTRRAVKVGKQQWNSATLRGLLKRNTAAKNPLTRQPLPNRVAIKYGPAAPPVPARSRITKVDDAVEIGRIAYRVLSLSTANARKAMGNKLRLDRAHWELMWARTGFDRLEVWVRPAVQREPFGYFEMIGEGTNRTLVFHFFHPEHHTHWGDGVAAFKKAARRGGFIAFELPRPLRMYHGKGYDQHGRKLKKRPSGL